jgi:N-acetylneuraminic acid mutarotase
MAEAQYSPVAVVVDGKVYVMGGKKKVEAYDPVTDTWSEKAGMPVGRAMSSASVVNGKIYVVGGAKTTTMTDGTVFFESLALVHEYDPATDTWTKKASLQVPRYSPSTATAGGKIYAMGGILWERGAVSGKAASSVEEYDPEHDTWLPKADMPSAKGLAAAVALNEKIYMMGGMTKGVSGVTASVYEYDPLADAWTQKAAMPEKRAWASAVVHDGLIYVLGGADGYDEPASSSVFVYDPAADEWAELEEMPYERWGMAAGLVDSKVYLIGGSQSPEPFRPFSAEVWEYDLETGE